MGGNILCEEAEKYCKKKESWILRAHMRSQMKMGGGFGSEKQIRNEKASLIYSLSSKLSSMVAKP